MPSLLLRLSDDDDRPATGSRTMAEADALSLLNDSEITAAELVPWGSNYTFGVALKTASGHEHLGIYKPRAGEAPLWDFPSGTLYKREYAAYLLSRRLGWDLVPPTVVREGPHGIGSVQLYVEPDPETADNIDFWMQTRPDIERLVLFDLITNNADRKLGHCIQDQQGKVWGIDHGLTFNAHYKLRTVLWQYIGQPVSDDLLARLRDLLDDEEALRAEFRPWLTRTEVTVFLGRVRQVVEHPVYPGISSRRNVPYGWW